MRRGLIDTTTSLSQLHLFIQSRAMCHVPSLIVCHNRYTKIQNVTVRVKIFVQNNGWSPVCQLTYAKTLYFKLAKASETNLTCVQTKRARIYPKVSPARAEASGIKPQKRWCALMEVYTTLK